MFINNYAVDVVEYTNVIKNLLIVYRIAKPELRIH